ncbi:MAG: mechanosensitive ion channel domain-containing protein [Bacteroidota bacterium]
MEIINNIIGKIKQFLNITIHDGKDISITIGTLLLIIISCIVAYYLLRLIRRIITAKLPEDDKNKFVSIFKFINYLIYLVVVIIILSSSGIDLTVLLTASAALFVGLGFALQFLFQDLISGILIILDQSLHVGDIVEVEGKVTRILDIKLRTTRALTRNNKVIVIPNHKFLVESIFNYTQNSRVTREFVHVGVAYGSDVELVRQLLLESVNEVKEILKSPKPTVLFEDFADSALMFGIYFYISQPYIEPLIKSNVRFLIDKKFREHNVSIPFPQRDVHLYQQK